MAKLRNSSKQPPVAQPIYLNWVAFTWDLLIIPNPVYPLNPSTLAFHTDSFHPEGLAINSEVHLSGPQEGRPQRRHLESTLPTTTAQVPMLSSQALTKLPKTHFWRCPKPDPEALFGLSGIAGLYIGAATFHILWAEYSIFMGWAIVGNLRQMDKCISHKSG